MTSLPQNPAAAFTPPPYRSARNLATWSIGGLVVSMAAIVYTLVIDLEGFGLVADMLGGKDVSQRDLDAYEAKGIETAIVMLGGLAVASVAFCMWIFRASKNIQAFGRPLKMSPGWAVGSFFIPILSLWRPYVAIANVWEMSDPDLGPYAPTKGKTFVLVWWIVWAISGAGSWGDPAEVTDWGTLSTQSGLAWFSTVTGVVAGVMAIMLIHRLTRRQEVFAERYMVPAAQVVKD